MRVRLLVLALCLAALGVGFPRVAAAAPGDEGAFSIEAWADASLLEMLGDFAEDGDLGRLAGRSRIVMDTLIAWHPDLSESDAFARSFVVEQHAESLTRLAARARARSGEGTHRELADWLFDLGEDPAGLSGRGSSRRGSGWEVAKAMSAQRMEAYDKDAGVYGVLSSLREAFGDELNEYPELTAALAVVFDAGEPAKLIEQTVKKPVDAVGVFRHYTEHASSLQMDPGRMPAGLLIYAVDAAVSEDDLAWGLLRASGNSQVGAAFYEVTYDDNALRRGNDQLQLNREGVRGFGLQAILEVGGVCRHQAFYAANLGKSVGVPTVYMGADGMDVGHAWVGYLRKSSRRAYWDMSEGRFGEYVKVRGEIECPQTGREKLSDQEVAMSAELYGTDLDDRLACAALASAASRVAGWEKRAQGYPPIAPDERAEKYGHGPAVDDDAPGRRWRRAGPQIRDEPRPATTETRFALLREAAEASPWGQHTWAPLQEWGDEMSADERMAWFEATDQLIGKRYPDVLVTVVSSLIASVEDLSARDAAWGWLANRVRRSPQLSLEVEVHRADLLAEEGNKEAAWDAYASAARRYATEGPFVLTALERAEELMLNAADHDAGLRYRADLFGDVFRRVPRPTTVVAPEYLRGSTWYRVGYRYAQLLRAMGQDRAASQVRRQLRSVG